MGVVPVPCRRNDSSPSHLRVSEKVGEIVGERVSKWVGERVGKRTDEKVGERVVKRTGEIVGERVRGGYVVGE